MGKNFEVAIGTDKNRLRLIYWYGGKRQFLYLGLDATKANWKRATEIKRLIEADLEAGNFDPQRYQPDKTGRLAGELTCAELFQKWIAYKSAFVDANTVQWYGQTLSYLMSDRLAETKALCLTKITAAEFAAMLTGGNLHPETAKRKLENLTAAWKWAIEHGYAEVNPWQGLSKQIKVPQAPPIQPFTKNEMVAILQGFEKYHPLYLPFVRFLFGSGCRPGEAIALRWEDLSEDCTTVTIASQITRRRCKPPKNNKIRSFNLSNSLRKMLIEMRPTSASGLIFKSPKGATIDQCNFLDDAWKPTLERVKVAYRPPKYTRKTFVSHCLQKGLNPVVIAKITGHDVKVLFSNYAGVISTVEAPEI